MCSVEHSHVGSSDLLVGVAGSAQHPLGPGLAEPRALEEEKEHRSIEGLDSVLTVLHVAGLDLGALEAVR